MTSLSLFASSSKRRFRFDEIGHKLIRLSGLKKLDTEPVKTGSFRFFNPQTQKRINFEAGAKFQVGRALAKKVIGKKGSDKKEV